MAGCYNHSRTNQDDYDAMPVTQISLISFKRIPQRILCILLLEDMAWATKLSTFHTFSAATTNEEES